MKFKTKKKLYWTAGIFGAVFLVVLVVLGVLYGRQLFTTLGGTGEYTPFGNPGFESEIGIGKTVDFDMSLQNMMWADLLNKINQEAMAPAQPQVDQMKLQEMCKLENIGTWLDSSETNIINSTPEAQRFAKCYELFYKKYAYIQEARFEYFQDTYLRDKAKQEGPVVWAGVLGDNEDPTRGYHNLKLLMAGEDKEPYPCSQADKYCVLAAVDNINRPGGESFSHYIDSFNFFFVVPQNFDSWLVPAGTEYEVKVLENGQNVSKKGNWGARDTSGNWEYKLVVGEQEVTRGGKKVKEQYGYYEGTWPSNLEDIYFNFDGETWLSLKEYYYSMTNHPNLQSTRATKDKDGNTLTQNFGMSCGQGGLGEPYHEKAIWCSAAIPSLGALANIQNYFSYKKPNVAKFKLAFLFKKPQKNETVEVMRDGKKVPERVYDDKGNCLWDEANPTKEGNRYNCDDRLLIDALVINYNTLMERGKEKGKVNSKGEVVGYMEAIDKEKTERVKLVEQQEAIRQEIKQDIAQKKDTPEEKPPVQDKSSANPQSQPSGGDAKFVPLPPCDNCEKTNQPDDVSNITAPGSFYEAKSNVSSLPSKEFTVKDASGNEKKEKLSNINVDNIAGNKATEKFRVLEKVDLSCSGGASEYDVVWGEKGKFDRVLDRQFLSKEKATLVNLDLGKEYNYLFTQRGDGSNKVLCKGTFKSLTRLGNVNLIYRDVLARDGSEKASEVPQDAALKQASIAGAQNKRLGVSQDNSGKWRKDYLIGASDAEIMNYDSALEGGGMKYWDERPMGLTELYMGIVFDQKFNQALNILEEIYTKQGASAAVDYIYEHMMGRSSDAEGKKFWVGVMSNSNAANRLSPRMVAFQFMLSEEILKTSDSFSQWSENEKLVELAALRSFLRTLSSGDLKYHTSNKNFKGSNEVVTAFVKSKEFEDKTKSLTNAQFVESLWLAVLGRGIEVQGRDDNVKRLESGKINRSQLIEEVLQSAEFRAKNKAF
jgi:hypothetical protein